jgi:hypothetical protein
VIMRQETDGCSKWTVDHVVYSALSNGEDVSCDMEHGVFDTLVRHAFYPPSHVGNKLSSERFDLYRVVRLRDDDGGEILGSIFDFQRVRDTNKICFSFYKMKQTPSGLQLSDFVGEYDECGNDLGEYSFDDTYTSRSHRLYSVHRIICGVEEPRSKS